MASQAVPRAWGRVRLAAMPPAVSDRSRERSRWGGPGPLASLGFRGRVIPARCLAALGCAGPQDAASGSPCAGRGEWVRLDQCPPAPGKTKPHQSFFHGAVHVRDSGSHRHPQAMTDRRLRVTDGVLAPAPHQPQAVTGLTDISHPCLSLSHLWAQPQKRLALNESLLGDGQSQKQ